MDEQPTLPPQSENHSDHDDSGQAPSFHLRDLRRFVPHLSVALISFALENKDIIDLIFTNPSRPSHN